MTPKVEDFTFVTEIDDRRVVESLFRRKFNDAPPDVPHHVVTFYRAGEIDYVPASYVHFRPFGDIILVGGAATDGRAIARMSDAERDAVKSSGGLYLAALRWAFARYARECEAFFGYCGDPRAYEVDVAAGFRDTPHPHLIVNFHKPLHEVMQRALIAKAHAIGSF